MTQPEEPTKDEKEYEVDSEWLKAKLESLESGFSKIVETLSKQSETRSNSEEPKETPQTQPSEIQVTQPVGHVEAAPQNQNNKPRSRLVIRGPKLLRR
jgi:hypothetical protein